MNRIKRIFAFIICLLAAPLFFWENIPQRVCAATESAGECVIELSSRRFLHEKNADKNMPMASTTKILTALIILTDENLDEIVTVPKQAENTEGSSVYLKAGEEITVRDLLYGLMLRSGNDCAVTLALHHSGSIEKFAEKMNERAVSIGAVNSHFCNPHGLPDERHYTTARDLALITATAMENENFRKIVSCKYYEPRGWKNKNKMLWEFEGTVGVKTGYTVKAGRCLVSSAEREGMTLISVVLNSPEMFERSEELLTNAFSDYRLVPLCSSEEKFEGFTLYYDFSYPLSDEEQRKIRFIKELKNPLPEVGEAGLLEIYLENRLLFSQNLFII